MRRSNTVDTAVERESTGTEIDPDLAVHRTCFRTLKWNGHMVSYETSQLPSLIYYFVLSFHVRCPTLSTVHIPNNQIIISFLFRIGAIIPPNAAPVRTNQNSHRMV